MKVLAIDLGSRRVGLASGDSDNRIAFPKAVIQRKNDKQVIDEIIKIVSSENYEVVVFGLPLSMNSESGTQVEFTNGFMDEFSKVCKEKGLHIEVTGVDERLSSFEADSFLNDVADVSGRPVSKSKKSGDRDLMSAKVILERYFSDLN